MQFKSIASIVGLLLFVTSGNCNPLDVIPSAKVCNADNCLRALRRFGFQAGPFCSEYLGFPKETVTATVTPAVTLASVSAIQHPNVDKRAAATHIARDGGVVFGLDNRSPIVARQVSALPSYVSQYNASRVSSACSCMTIPLATETVTVIASAQNATVTAGGLVDLRGLCRTRYKASGNGSGNRVDFFWSSSEQDCCERCQAKTNCVASAYIGRGTCQHLMNDYKVDEEEITAKCPLGVENYYFGPANASGIVYAGPCGV